MIISKWKMLLLASLFFESHLDAHPLIVPITFRPSLSFKHLESDLIKFKIARIITKSFADIEDLVKKQQDRENDLLLKRLRKIVIHFSIKDIDTALTIVAEMKSRALLAGGDIEIAFQSLRLGLLLKATLELFNQAHEALVESIETLEKNEEYWDRQLMYSSYHFLHRSPLQWFGKKSFKSVITDCKKKSIELRRKQEEFFGTMPLLISQLNDSMSGEEQFLWFKKSCTFLSTMCLNQPFGDAFITHENSVSVVKQLHKALNNHDRFMQGQIKDLRMPSHFERNWTVYAGAAAAVVGCYWYMKKHPQALENSFRSIQNFLVKNYTNHLKEPLCDIKKALFVSNEEVNFAAQNLKKLISESKPSFETAEKLKKDYVEICNTIGKTLDIPINNEELAQKAGELNQDYLDNLCQSITNTWKKGGYVVESFWNPLQQTTKSKVLNVLPDLGILIYRVAKLTGRNLAINGGEILISRIDELERKLNLTVAAVSLLPAYFVISRTVMAVRSFGGFLLPKGYDDTPIKNYITKMHDLLDDIVYIDSLKTADAIDPALIGKLLYYSARVEEEAEHLSQKNKTALKNLLEKFYITNDLKGKHLYLEKILHEYHSWPRFIQR